MLFERICRENGISQRRTKPRSPTTTGKVERLHRTLREEFLNHVAPFESPTAAQQAIDGWVTAYNHQRPHQALDMAAPASLFRPNGPDRLTLDSPSPSREQNGDQSAEPTGEDLVVDMIEPPNLVAEDGVEGAAVEFEARVPPSGELSIVSNRQSLALHRSMAGRTVTVWADLRSIHALVDGQVVRTVSSRLAPQDLCLLAMKGARPADPVPDRPALRRLNGTPVPTEGGAVEIERMVTRYGTVAIAGERHLIGARWSGRRVVLRLDGHLLHAIADGALIGSWPCPVEADRLARLSGARTPSAPLPPPPLPAGSLRAQRKVHASGRIMVAKQFIKLGPRHAGKIVTVVIEDTHFRVLHGEEEITVRPRKDPGPVTRLYVKGKGTRPERQASVDDKTSSKS